jgi:hypothetical protein
MTMAIRARIGDLVFEVETESDLRLLLAVAKDSSTAQPAAEVEGVGERLRRFLARLRSDGQRQVVRTLASAPEGLTDRELREALKIDSNNQLAGLMAGLSRHARAVGLRMEQVLVHRKVRAPGVKYHYRLTADMREIAGGKEPMTLV